MNDASNANRHCTSLGLSDDADTSLAYPSNWNCCYRSLPVTSPRFNHQEEFCLSGKYLECPVFLSQQIAPLPAHIRSHHNPSNISTSKNISRRSITIALTVTIVALALGWGILSQGSLPLAVEQATRTTSASLVPVATTTPIPTMIFSLIQTIPSTATLPVPSGSVTITKTPTLADTPTPAITLTHTATPTSILFKRHLDIPIGTDYKFVIHKASGGESLEQFADQYNTSVEAIMAINYPMTNPLWSGVLLVIPVGFTDVTGMPIFVVYEVKEEERGISVESLAKKLRVDPHDLKYYNGMTAAGDRPLVGDLFLVPRPRPVP
jgi:LysM repeat protein